MNEHRNASRISKGERGIWQSWYWEHLIRNENNFERHVDYIHYNPIKKWRHPSGKRMALFKHSPVHKTGIISSDWGGYIDNSNEGSYGER